VPPGRSTARKVGEAHKAVVDRGPGDLAAALTGRRSRLRPSRASSVVEKEEDSHGSRHQRQRS
jgi:hypothetical protein